MKSIFVILIAISIVSCKDEACEHHVLYGEEIVSINDFKLIMPKQRKQELLEAVQSGDMSAAVNLSTYNDALNRREEAYYWAKKAYDLGWKGITAKQLESMEAVIYESVSVDENLPTILPDLK